MAIVVSHIGPSFDALARQALRQAPLADLIEIRLDQCPEATPRELAALAGASPKPLIAACAGPEAHGHFRGSDAQRLALLLRAAEAGFGFVDVPWTLALELGPVPGKCHRIVSRHELVGTPQQLGPLVEEMRAVLGEGDLMKLVTHAQRCEDGLRMLAFLRTQKALIGFCSGAAGSFTRALARIFGSPFTYAAPAIVPGPNASAAAKSRAAGSPEAAQQFAAGVSGAESASAATQPPLSAPGQLRVNDLVALFPPGGISQETAIFGVVGRPVGASFSPRVHGMALKAARLDALYLAFEPESFETFLDLCSDDAFRGFSITAPFKRAAWQRASSRDAGAQRCGACNTLVREGAGWRGLNTDAGAVRETLERALGFHSREPGRPVALPVASALVLGTGGAARAAASAVLGARGKVQIAGRSLEHARALAAELGCDALAWDEIPRATYDILIHATPLGSLAAPGQSPLTAQQLRPGTLVLDAVYRPIRTPLLKAAVERGCTAVPGGEWFVRQAAEQFKAFTGVAADDALLRKAFEHALGADR